MTTLRPSLRSWIDATISGSKLDPFRSIGEPLGHELKFVSDGVLESTFPSKDEDTEGEEEDLLVEASGLQPRRWKPRRDIPNSLYVLANDYFVYAPTNARPQTWRHS